MILKQDRNRKGDIHMEGLMSNLAATIPAGNIVLLFISIISISSALLKKGKPALSPQRALSQTFSKSDPSTIIKQR